MKLFVATSNPGKLRDFAYAARAFPEVEILPLPGIERMAPPEETADTFEGNALIKALAYGELAPDEIVVADDSGIAVRGLGGAPGVRSARYAEDEGFFLPGKPDANLDERNNACLLERAAKLRYRDVSYFCVLAAVRNGELLATATGELQGRLALEPHGDEGFGYDPIFEVLELSRTMAQIEPEIRLQISHRGRALVKLLKALQVLPDGLAAHGAVPS
jgi:XTP/dITP diphosphohydrolase